MTGLSEPYPELSPEHRDAIAAEFDRRFPGPQRFRKKPVEIEAMKWTGDNADDVRAWVGQDFDTLDPEDRTEDPDHTAQLFVAANGRWLGIEDGEWIIRDQLGHYPCKPDVFEQTYEHAVPVISVQTYVDSKPRQVEAVKIPGSARSPLQELDDAIHRFVAATGGEGKAITGWVLGAATTRIEHSDDDILPLRSGEVYALGPQTAVVTAAGLARFLSITIEHHMLAANDD